jgi:antitoxin (DNA-binding transcriptional repressor) of toxin-antitoxin stability system
MEGEEVIIAKAGTPVVRLVPIHADASPRRGGRWKGRGEARRPGGWVAA